MWQELTKTVLLIVASLFPIVNPPASAFMAISIVPHATDAEREQMARRVAWNSFTLLLASFLIGAYVLQFFGISIPVLRVAGGLVVAMAGWKLLNADNDVEEDQDSEVEAVAQHHARRDPSFYPLTLPLTVGPGSIAVAIALGTGSPREGPIAVHFAAVGISLVVIAASIYLCMRFAERIERTLGSTGTQVVMRLFAFIIFCIGLQILWLGLSELAGLVMHPVPAKPTP
jgi:multiple antibiotic resistance protein